MLLGLGFLLLLLDQRLNHGRLGLVLVVLVIEKFFLLLFLRPRIAHLLLDLQLVRLLLLLNFELLLLLDGLVHQLQLCLLVCLLLHPDLLFLLVFDVAPSLLHDFRGFLAGLVDFLEGAVLFLLEQVDPVGEQLQVLLCALPSDLGSD